MKLVWLLFLIVVSLTAPTILVQSSLSTKIVTSGNTVNYPGSLNTNYASYLGLGTRWIWNQKGDLSPRGTKLTFQSWFHMTCGTAPVLKISAQASFVAYLDGVQIGTGNDWRSIYTFNLKASCGFRNLTIVVTRGANPGAGLIFTVSQDQSKCYNCAANGFWNYYTCRCQCLPSSCSCKAPRSIWAAYPTCACTCPNRPLSCRVGYYYDGFSCKCQCNIQRCPGRSYWSSTSCKCEPIII